MDGMGKGRKREIHFNFVVFIFIILMWMQSSSQVTCVYVCACAGPGARSLHFCVWSGFAGPLLAKAEGVPGIFGEGGLPGLCLASQRPASVTSRHHSSGLLKSVCAIAGVPWSCSWKLMCELQLVNVNFSGFSPVGKASCDKGMCHPTLGFPLEFGR